MNNATSNDCVIIIFMENNFFSAFILTIIAGLSTGIGALAVFVINKRNPNLLSFGLGFSAGVMVYVSFMELLPHAGSVLESVYGHKSASMIRMACFFGGIALTAIIDKLIPEDENPHETRTEEEFKDIENRSKKHAPTLARTGLFTALAIGIHNFPEGFAVFSAGYAEPALGGFIALAIALHNIPEGISVSVPIYYATGNRMKAFLYSLISGLAEPAGALIGFVLLKSFMNEVFLAGTFAAIAGVMLYISFDELLPTARKYGKGHAVILGVALGMLLMAFGLDFIGHQHG